jgi:hypothetical protein
LDCLENAKNFTGTVRTDILPYNSGLDHSDLDPVNSLHSFGSPNYPDDVSETIAGDVDDDTGASKTDPAVLQVAAILISMRKSRPPTSPNASG